MFMYCKQFLLSLIRSWINVFCPDVRCCFFLTPVYKCSQWSHLIQFIALIHAIINAKVTPATAPTEVLSHYLNLSPVFCQCFTHIQQNVDSPYASTHLFMCRSTMVEWPTQHYNKAVPIYFQETLEDPALQRESPTLALTLYVPTPSAALSLLPSILHCHPCHLWQRLTIGFPSM